MSFVKIDETESLVKAMSAPSLTLTVENEDHTLGNALRAMLSSRPDVEFAGYSIPHPTETHFNLRIQTVSDEVPAMQVFQETLDDLTAMSLVILEKLNAQTTLLSSC
eukprot:Gregarina_sp_Pseudo_9__1966@NODE_2359_length_1026_cov_2_735562_g2172_i0_p1_GENE_NODE_2359_length_1026_cov_2_735562_g2172_i0NODE_2359_length_1026_cov_2_735562_g2172_i0_p1_ORF_typecomplete_len107_score20_33RNA_pol_L_2/PF13656_6/6_1e27DUF1833/PF08875_11/0_09RNA_pol_L/PF01193_24/2_7RNA_pol_L/PF01193_24/90_NODE_2359_length_1026_cov_2_735562_g2172_i0636956